MSDFVPLSVRTGGPAKRFVWRVKKARESLALWIAPWLTPQHTTGGAKTSGRAFEVDD